MTASGLVLDAGAFIAIEQQSPEMVEYVREFRAQETPLVTSAGVVAQVWRGGAHKQVPVAFLLRRTDVVDLTDVQARMVSKLLGMSGTGAIDASLALYDI